MLAGVNDQHIYDGWWEIFSMVISIKGGVMLTDVVVCYEWSGRQREWGQVEESDGFRPGGR